MTYIRSSSVHDILLAGYYNNVALIYQELGDYDKAVDALEHALSIIERHENAGTGMPSHTACSQCR